MNIVYRIGKWGKEMQFDTDDSIGINVPLVSETNVPPSTE